MQEKIYKKVKKFYLIIFKGLMRKMLGRNNWLNWGFMNDAIEKINLHRN